MTAFESQKYAKDFAMSRIQSEREGLPSLGAGIQQGVQGFLEQRQQGFMNQLRMRQLTMQEAENDAFVASEALKREEIAQRTAALREKMALGMQRIELESAQLDLTERRQRVAAGEREAKGQIDSEHALRYGGGNREVEVYHDGTRFSTRPRSDESKKEWDKRNRAEQREEIERKKLDDRRSALIERYKATLDTQEQARLGKMLDALDAGDAPTGSDEPLPALPADYAGTIVSRTKAVTHASATALANRLKIKGADENVLEFAKKHLAAMPGDEVRKRIAYFLRSRPDVDKDPARREMAVQDALLEIVRAHYERLMATRAPTAAPVDPRSAPHGEKGWVPREDGGR